MHPRPDRPRYAVEVEVSSELIHNASIDVVHYAEAELRDRLRTKFGPEIANRGRVVWTARLEVSTERNDR